MLKSTLLLLTLAAFAIKFCRSTEFLILHNNDMHARFEQTSKFSGKCKDDKTKPCYGGFARVAHVIREARKEDTPVLYLNGGDTYTGTPWFSIHKWKIVVDFLNILQPDAMSLGNHEFDFGVEGLLPFLANYKYPVICANLDVSEEPKFNVTMPKSVTVTVDKAKVGIIGYLTTETKTISDVGRIKLTDEVEAIKKESIKLQKEGVNIIIALGHAGFDIDKKIAAEVPLVDIVIGGHTNTFLWNGKEPDVETAEGLYPTVIKQPSGKKVPVVQAYAYTKYMGKLLVTFDSKGDLIKYIGMPQLLSNTVPQDQDVLDLLDTYRPEIDALSKQIVGKSLVVLDSSKCRLRECNFGNLIADAMVAQKASSMAGHYWTDTPIAIVNSGSIRTTINVGQITVEELIGAQPFDLQIISFDLRGEDLLTMLETSVRSNGETSLGEFLQVSGLNILYDKTKPTGQRVVSVEARCGKCIIPHYEPFNITKTYRLLATSYIMNAGDGYEVLRDKSFNRKTEDLGDVDLLIWYLQKYSPVFPEEEGRIKFVGPDNSSSKFSFNVWVLAFGFITYLLK